MLTMRGHTDVKPLLLSVRAQKYHHYKQTMNKTIVMIINKDLKPPLI